MAHISSQSFQFLTDLTANNDRSWFQEHKVRYEAYKSEATGFQTALKNEMNKIDSIEKTKMFRIYRDVRFSKDKSPYNPHLSISLTRTKPLLRGGYFLRIKPGESAIACGFWKPDSADMLHIRKNIAADPKAFEEAIGAKSIISTFGSVSGEKLKSAPRGFPKDDPAIDYLKYKQFLFVKDIEDGQVLQNDFINVVVDTFRAVRPFFDYMSYILTHDLNGEPLHY